MARGDRKRKATILPADHYIDVAKRHKQDKDYLTNYAPATRQKIESAKKQWINYCTLLQTDADELLELCEIHWFKSFLQWLLDTSPNITKQSTVVQVWKCLRQYRREKYGPMDPHISSQVTIYLKGQLTVTRKLDKVPSPKPVMDAKDLLALLDYHWRYDTGQLSHERHRVQLPLLLLLTAYTSSRPGALVESGMYPGTNEGLHYKDVQLGLLRPYKDAKAELVMEVTLRFTKGERNGIPKTYVMHLNDENHAMCPIIHLIALAIADDAFEEHLTAESIFNIDLPPNLNFLHFRWKSCMQDIPIFRRTEAESKEISANKIMTDNNFRKQLRALGLRAGFKEVLTPYCLRRGTGNEVDAVANPIQRRQVMGHADDSTFQKHYMSTTVRVDVQAVFLHQPSRLDLIKCAGVMSRWRNNQAPVKITDAQKTAVRNRPEVKEARRLRDAKTAEIRKSSTIRTEKSKNSALYREYLELNQAYTAMCANFDDAVLQETRNAFFEEYSGEEIRSQLAGDRDEPKPDLLPPSKHQFHERAELAQVLFEPVSGAERRRILVEAMVRLCGLKEWKPPSDKADTKSEAGWHDLVCDVHVNCTGNDKQFEEGSNTLACDVREHPPATMDYPQVIDKNQCIFCMGDASLPYHNRIRSLSRPDSLRRHIANVHLDKVAVNDQLLCPHPVCTKLLQGRMMLLNHCAVVHGTHLE